MDELLKKKMLRNTVYDKNTWSSPAPIEKLVPPLDFFSPQRQTRQEGEVLPDIYEGSEKKCNFVMHPSCFGAFQKFVDPSLSVISTLICWLINTRMSKVE